MRRLHVVLRAAGAGATLVAVQPLVAQRPTRPDTAARRDTAPAPRPGTRREDPDSLAARLARAEAAIALLKQQMAAESEAAVRTRSRTAFELSARVLTNTYWTSHPASDFAVPSFAVPAAPAARTSAVGLSLRQTRVGAAFTERDVLGGTFDGDLDLDFFGGGRDASGNRPLFPEPRLRTARMWLRWPRGAVMVGAETPLVSDLDPLSLAAVGIPLFGAAGNLWNWLPQVRASHELFASGRGAGAVRWALQGAVLAPYSGVAYGDASLAPGDPYAGGTSAATPASSAPTGDAAERSGRPFFETRLRARWGREDPDATPNADVRDAAVGEGPSEAGVGLHRGWVRAGDNALIASGAATFDARVAFARRWELRGEGYVGRLVAGLGGGGIAQNFGRPLVTGGARPPVRDAAAWAQLNVRPATTVVTGVGCGLDRARTADRPDRERNLACAAHARWRPAQPLLLGLELRRMATRYAGGTTYQTSHVNLAFGFEL